LKIIKRAAIVGILPLISYGFLIVLIGSLAFFSLFFPEIGRQILPWFAPLIFLYAIATSFYFAWIVTGALDRLIVVLENLNDDDDSNDAETFPVLSPLAQRKDGFGQIALLFIQFIKTTIEKKYWYASILDNLPLSVFVTDAKKNLTLVNQPTETLLGANRSQLLGQSILGRDTKMFQLLEKGSLDLSQQRTSSISEQDGKYYQLDAAGLFDSDGNNSGLIEIVQNVSSAYAALNFQQTAIAALTSDLERMAQGIYAVPVSHLAAGDENTKAIQHALGDVRDHIEAVRQMTSSLLQTAIQEANSVLSSSEMLTQTADQSEMAASQIAATIQEVAQGATDTSHSVLKTADTVQNMNTLLESVTTGIDHQSDAVQKASQVTQKISGSGGIADTVAYFAREIQKLLVESEKINDILDTINDFASQTNLLAINAAIETAHVETQGETLTEAILNRQMVTQARLLDHLLCNGKQAFNTEYWDALSRYTGIDTICITDQDGVVVISNEASLIGWRFPDDPKAQAFEFRKLIGQKDGFVCQKPQKRSIDNRTFKFVGVSRNDEPGIVQVAFDADSLSTFQMRLGGFAVVAEEVRKLAEKSTEATKEIAQVVNAMHKHVADSVKMADKVSTNIQSASAELDDAISVVSQAVDQNKHAIADLASGLREIMTMVEGIAAVSEENSASTEEVSAATEEMNTQAQEVGAAAKALHNSAKELLEMLSRFSV
jgi:methyl-accepting chemotaxis protein